MVASDRARRAPAPSPEGKWPTAELHKIEPFHYLVSLLRHSAKVAPVSYTHLTLPTNREV